LHGCSALTPFALVRSLVVVAAHPCIQASLHLFDFPVDLFAEGNGVKLILDGLVKALEDAT
jgi:hypothetical protein